VSRTVSRRRLLGIGVAIATSFVTAAPAAAGILNATWTMPTTNADGTPLTNLSSFKVYYGTSNTPCPGSTFVSMTAPTSSPGPNQTASTTLTNLTTGTTYFASVTAVNSSGSESSCSPVASAVARSDFSVTPSTTVDFGSVNIGTTADQTFTVQNTGGGTVSGSATTSAPFSVVSGGSFNLVGVGATATVTMRFTPTVAALATGNATFTANSGSVSRTLTGTGAPGSNAVPTLAALSPTSVTAGGPAFTLTVNGSGFVSGSSVRWNGSARTTTFLSATQLTAAITAADIATAGSVPVTVFSPTPGGGTSSAVTFSVNNPSPTLTSLSPSAAAAGGAAFTLTLTGTNFVSGSTVRWNGSARTTTFVSATQLTAAITAADIVTVGTVPVTVFTPTPGGSTSTAVTFSINNPAPTVTSASPTSAAAGGAAFTLTVNGTNFVNGSTVRWNGNSRTTTFVSATQLTAAITATDIATAGNVPVTVFTPTPGGGTSTAATFAVNNPAPTLSTLSPAGAIAGSAAFTLTVNGSNFVNGSTINWNGSARATTFVSATQLTTAIAAADIATAGSVPVTVVTPAPGGGTSATLTFPIAQGTSTLTAISPTSATAGGAPFTLTVTGSGFVSGSTVNWNGSARTTTFVSATQLTAAIAAADIATAGTAQVTVTGSAGSSGAVTFTINNPAPTISTLSPTSATAGGAAFTLTVTGTNFVNGSTVRWNGSVRTTTFVSATQLTAAITAADIATAGSAPITVFSPTPGGGTSSALTFSINTGAPTVTSLSPSGATAGNAAFTLTVTGTNFVSGSTVNWNGSARTTTFVSAMQLTAAITAADIAVAGTASVTVTTPAGTSAAVNFPITAGGPTLTSISPTSATAGGAAFTLTATGSNFVSGSTVNWNGSSRATTFVSATQLTAAITAADIATAGSAQVTVTASGRTSAAITLAVNNPAPVISGLSPASATVGGAAFTLTVNGTGFTSGSTVRWNGAARTTTVVSATQLTAAISAADIATAGGVPVTVVTPTPGGGTSSALTFSVNTSAPSVSALSPSSASAGSAAFTLTVNGGNFVNGATVNWNGSARTTTFVSSTQLTAAISAADIASAGLVSVTVAGGGATSAALTFSVSNPAPVVSGLAPAAATAGTGSLTLVVNGSGFTSGSTVRWNGNQRTTAFWSASQLTAIITAADVSVAGTAQVSVVTPAPGGGTSGSMAFAVNAGSTVNVGLVGYWRFNEGSGTTAADFSGVSGPGTLVNGPAWTSGRVGQALSFNGVNAYVDVVNNPVDNAFPLTVAVWIKTSSTTGVSGILSKATAGTGYAIYLSNGNLCATFFRDASNRVDDGSGCPLATAGFTDNQWHHVTYVVDASGARLYVDGVLRASLGWIGSGGAPATTQDLLIGRYPGAPAPEFFQGVIDDVRVYARALGASEAMELFTNFGTVADTTPPAISALTATMVTSSTATVTFVTNEPSDTQLEYGTTAAYGTLSTLQPALGATHAQTLNSLAPGTTYYVRARSRDFSGNLAVSSGITFRTTDSPAVADPVARRKHRRSFFEQIFSFLGF
jgi:Concanavalin A-like lectin/glucanases superfamily